MFGRVVEKWTFVGTVEFWVNGWGMWLVLCMD